MNIGDHPGDQYGETYAYFAGMILSGSVRLGDAGSVWGVLPCKWKRKKEPDC